MARLVEAGCEVRYVAFSIATRSLPPGFGAGHARARGAEATAELGIPESHSTVHDFDVRTPRAAPGHPRAPRRALGGMAADVVFQPSHHDVHQDHQTIAQEGLRPSSGRRSSVTRSWNNFELLLRRLPRALERRHVERKVAASRAGTRRSSTVAMPTRSTSGTSARVHGTSVNRDFAEVFQVYRVVA